MTKPLSGRADTDFQKRLGRAEAENGVMREALARIERIVYPPLDGAVEVTSKRQSHAEVLAERDCMAQDLDRIADLAACALVGDSLPEGDDLDHS